jgi:exosortase/archaeosortase family protein
MRLPVAFAVFCIPIPAPLLATWLWELRLFTAEYTGWLLYWIGVPALVSGDQILRASQAFQVIDGCSGFRSAETLTMLVVLMIDLFGRHGLHALLLLVSAPLVAFGLNGVRVLTLVLNPHSEIVAIHSLQGIAILLVGLLVVYVLDGVLGRLLPPRRMDPAKPGAQGGRALASEQLLAAALATAIVLVGIGLLTPVWSEPRPPRVLEDLVRGALPETDEAKEVGEDIYFSGKTAFRESIHRLYAKGAHSVELFVGTSDLRDRRATIVSPANSRPGSGWMLREARIVRVGKDDDPVLAQWVERGLDRRLTWSWYLGTRGTAEEALRNWLGLERSELRREGAQLVARLSTQTPSVGETDPRAEGRLEQFFERLQPALAAAVAPPSP